MVDLDSTRVHLGPHIFCMPIVCAEIQTLIHSTNLGYALLSIRPATLLCRYCGRYENETEEPMRPLSFRGSLLGFIGQLAHSSVFQTVRSQTSPNRVTVQRAIA